MTGMFPFMIAAINRHHSCKLQCTTHPCLISSSNEEDDDDEEEETQAKKSTSNTTIGGMWKFLPPCAKRRALEEAREYLDLMKLNTVYHLLLIMPDSVRCGIPSDY
mmetsp:Transcript_8177/g.10420  ORF Transcript_8177/g.10420 Transcript_8177/m.10420 type:complete len:106 (+) Transcript_8177:2-319(+)